MTGNPLAAELQRERDAQVAAAVAAERVRIADEIRALLLDRDALRAWLAAHVLRDPGVGAVLAVLNRDLRGTCGMCRGPAEFVGETAGAQTPQDPHSGAAYMESPQPTPENRPTDATARP